jgi:hypothetical protein
MITRYQKTIDPDGPEKDKKPAKTHAGAGHDDSCRCKETSQMTPRELFKLMMRDLAFWKKAKEDKR